MDEIVKIFNLQRLVEEGGEESVWGALLATIVARLDGNVTLTAEEMAQALSKKEMVLERMGDGELNIRLTEYSNIERN